jgi:hypothetical protein
MKKIFVVVLVLLVCAYVVIQSQYVFKETPMSANAVFTKWTHERIVNWPIGDTLITRIRPMHPSVAEQFKPYDMITVDRFFYKKTYKIDVKELEVNK